MDNNRRDSVSPGLRTFVHPQQEAFRQLYVFLRILVSREFDVHRTLFYDWRTGILRELKQNSFRRMLRRGMHQTLSHTVQAFRAGPGDECIALICWCIHVERPKSDGDRPIQLFQPHQPLPRKSLTDMVHAKSIAK